MKYDFYSEVLCKLLTKEEIDSIKDTNVRLLFNNIFGEFRLNSEKELINVVTNNKYKIEKNESVITIKIIDEEYENDLVYSRIDIQKLTFEFNYVKNFNDLVIKKINDYSKTNDSAIQEMLQVFQFKNSVNYLKDKNVDITRSIFFENDKYALVDIIPDGARMFYRYLSSDKKNSYYSTMVLPNGETQDITDVKNLYDDSYDLLLGESDKYINNKSGIILVKRY